MTEQTTTRAHGVSPRLVILGLLLVFCSLWLLGRAADRAADSGKKIDVSDEFYQMAPVLCEVYMSIRDKYVEPVEPKVLIEGAIRGMFAELDPHSQWMPVEDYQQLEKETEGEFSGIGIHIILDKNRVLTVLAPIPGTPAAKAGLLPWDRIVEIEGESTKNITLMEAVKKLTGPTGTKVKIAVYREGASDYLHFTIERAQIKIDSVYSTEIKENAIGYVRLAKFSKETSDDLRKVLEQFNRDGIKGIILDVRFNTGGLLKEAIDVTDLFLTKGKAIVSTRGRAGIEATHYSENDPVVDQPLVVLVNRGSASASEIFAGAVKDHHRGYLIAPEGTRTFGKGSVQTIEELVHSLERDEDGNPRQSAVRITTAKFYTPNGTRIEEVEGDPKQPGGIAPDLEVTVPKGYERELFSNLLGEVDLEEPETKPAQPPADVETPRPEDEKTTAGATDEFYLKKPEKPEEKFVDVQLEEAKKYLRLLIMEHERKSR